VRVAWRDHAERFQLLDQRQQLERDRLVAEQQTEWQRIAAEREQQERNAKARAPSLRRDRDMNPIEARSILEDRKTAKSDFEKAAKEPPGKQPNSRSRDDWRRYRRDKDKDRDFER
jgi:chlorite dismutase